MKGHGVPGSPWEIAKKEVKEEVSYKSNADSSPLPYDLDENEADYERLEYVECLFSSNDKKLNNRVIGLFILRLHKRIEFVPGDEKEVVCIKYFRKHSSILLFYSVKMCMEIDFGLLQ